MPMNRIIAWALVALLVPCLLVPPAAAATHTDARVYVAGVGLLELPLCGGATSTNLLAVCFALAATDATVTFEIKEDLGGKVVGRAYFVNVTGAAVGPSEFFCVHSSTLSIPSGATAARVVLGPLPEVAEIPGCLPSVATSGRVIARFT